MRVYVAGPMTLGPLEENIRKAMDAAAILLANDFEPFVPHLFAFMQIVHPQHYERWMRMDFAFIRVCEAVLRIPGESKGADRECIYADTRHIPVFGSIDELIKWRNDNAATVRELVDSVPGVELAKKRGS